MQRSNDISVALCTYNGERYLEQQLESIAKQTKLPAELVICDDCSTDSTPAIIKAFAQSAPFSVKYVENQKNIGSEKKGITRNFEKAAQLCSKSFIALCDQDDAWFPEKLERLSAVLESDSQYGGVFSDARLMDQNSHPTGVRMRETTGFDLRDERRLQHGEALPVLLAMTKVYGCTLMFRASLLDQILPVPPSWWFDAWFACMIAIHSKLAFVSEPLFYYRIHPSQQVGASAPSLSKRIQQWRTPAKQYSDQAQPQLIELCERLQTQSTPDIQAHLEYLRGRLALMQVRSNLPSNRLMRLGKILPATRDYHRYFNGWKSIIKDITT
jgi:glycosyltransferase involved in cell wall biosynthesis